MNGKVFVTGPDGPREATWQEAYGMHSSNEPPSTETVRYVRWLESRLRALEVQVNPPSDPNVNPWRRFTRHKLTPRMLKHLSMIVDREGSELHGNKIAPLAHRILIQLTYDGVWVATHLGVDALRVAIEEGWKP